MQPRPFQRRGPSGPLAKGSIIQYGYDQPAAPLLLAALTSPFSAVLPRNVALDPLEVVLLNVKAGNVLEIDYRLNIFNSADGTVAFSALAVVSFKDSPVYPIDFKAVDNALSNFQPGGNAAGIWQALIGLVIPADAAKATVRIAYDDNDSGAFQMGGVSDLTVPASTLKVSELDGDILVQPSPTSLVAIP